MSSHAKKVRKEPQPSYRAIQLAILAELQGLRGDLADRSNCNSASAAQLGDVLAELRSATGPGFFKGPAPG